MEGVQKHGGGGCEECAVGHSEHVAAGTVRSITQTQRGFNPRHPLFPRTMKKIKPKEKEKANPGGKRRWEENAWGDAAMGHCTFFDHARLMVAWWHGTEGGEMLHVHWSCNKCRNVHVRSSLSLSACFLSKHHLLPPTQGPLGKTYH